MTVEFTLVRNSKGGGVGVIVVCLVCSGLADKQRSEIEHIFGLDVGSALVRFGRQKRSLLFPLVENVLRQIRDLREIGSTSYLDIVLFYAEK